ncbi:MAG: hypothetical protein KF872_04250 [Chitinophagales bacterium]|nr:hypothetical protein [Chitinophagales bacterium]
MKQGIFALLIVGILCSFSIGHKTSIRAAYASSEVEITSSKFGNKVYKMITMNRSNQRIKAKYFAFKEGGLNVYDRYQRWKTGKDIVLISSGTYIDLESYKQANFVPEGLTIDNGKIVNEKTTDKFDGFVIVYATGGIAVANIKEQKVNITCNGQPKSYDIKNNTFDRQEFIACAKDVEATTFQTHLLAFKDQPKVGLNGSQNKASRRFLAACKMGGVLYHVIVHTDEEQTLSQAALDAFDFLKKFKEMDEVIFMINLDTGMQNVFELYDERGNKRNDIVGKTPAEKATNLLVYYYE